MASRRVRIKGIANIPQRRKNVEEIPAVKPSGSGHVENVPNLENGNLNETAEEKVDANSNCVVKPEETRKLEPEPPATASTAESKPARRRILKPVIATAAIKRNTQKDTNDESPSSQLSPIQATNDDAESNTTNSNITIPNTETNNPPVKPLITSRRRVLKPTIAAGAIKRKAKETQDDKIESIVKNQPTEIISESLQTIQPIISDAIPLQSNIQLSPKVALSCATDIQENDTFTQPVHHEKVAAGTQILSPAVQTSAISTSPAKQIRNSVIKKIDSSVLEQLVKPLTLPASPHSEKTCISDTERDQPRPQPPASPNKLNRSRIKAVPRLSQQRRASFSIGSASESEDEARKSGNVSTRIRNDSVCSAASIADVSTGTLQQHENSSTRKEFSSAIRRKCRRTEQSRKLAEARRDFMHKFNDGKPDRQRLTMIDLIFYNPPTAPMSEKNQRSSDPAIDDSRVESSETPVVEAPAEEKSDEENTIPAPQIKIGPDGEIIIDEKSLVVENKEVARNREALKRSAVVDGDNESSYGIYRKKLRSKDWSKLETLRFYRALSTVGTDFTMMLELFPGRTRRQLKMKFKREERLNRILVDKAIMQPTLFDLTELRKQVEEEELELRLEEKRVKELEEFKLAQKEKRKLQKLEKSKNQEPSAKRVKVSKRKTASEFMKGGINSILGDESGDSDTSVSTVRSGRSVLSSRSAHSLSSLSGRSLRSSQGNRTDEEDDPLPKRKVQRTRSGRISKRAESVTKLPPISEIRKVIGKTSIILSNNSERKSVNGETIMNSIAPIIEGVNYERDLKLLKENESLQTPRKSNSAPIIATLRKKLISSLRKSSREENENEEAECIKNEALSQEVSVEAAKIEILKCSQDMNLVEEETAVGEICANEVNMDKLKDSGESISCTPSKLIDGRTQKILDLTLTPASTIEMNLTTTAVNLSELPTPEKLDLTPVQRFPSGLSAIWESSTPKPLIPDSLTLENVKLYTVNETGDQIPVELKPDVLHKTDEQKFAAPLLFEAAADDEKCDPVVDLVIDDSTMIIPFDEFENHLFNEKVPLLDQSGLVIP